MHACVARAAAVIAAAAACSGCATRAAADSVYTSLRENDCQAPPRDVAAPYEQRDLGVQQCPAQPGWQLLLVSSDASTWVDIRGANVAWSGERPIVYETPIGLFPSVDTATGVEWRRDGRGGLTAVIVRVLAQDRDALTTQQSRLFVVRVMPGGACLLDRVATAAEARALADGDRGC
jgi:hypothetical protein